MDEKIISASEAFILALFVVIAFMYVGDSVFIYAQF